MFNNRDEDAMNNSEDEEILEDGWGHTSLNFCGLLPPLKKQYAGFSPFKKAVCRLCSFPHVNAGFSLLSNMGQ